MKKSSTIYLGIRPGSSMADDEVYLPKDAYEDAIAIIGRRGRGKTTTAVVLAEEIHKLLHRFAALDPTGVWWGLKSSRDGKKAGLPVIIFGGEHGDVPLALASGKIIARFVADPKHPSVVLDLSGFDTEELPIFLTAFYRELLLVNRNLLHLIIDEAQFLVPEQPEGKDSFLMKKAAVRLIQLGRVKGILPILITPRPADIAKSALYACGMLVMHQLTSPEEQKSLHKWVKAHAKTQAQAQEFMEGMGKLGKGVAWIWQPDLEIFEKVAVRERETYPSSATAGVALKAPKARAKVDLDALKGEIAETIEKAQAEDPVVLGARLREAIARIDSLQAQLGKPRAHEKVAVVYAPGKELVVLSTYLDDKGVYTVDVELPTIKPVEVPALSKLDSGRLMRLAHRLEDGLLCVPDLLKLVKERVPDPKDKQQPIPALMQPLKKGDVVTDVHGRRSVITATSHSSPPARGAAREIPGVEEVDKSALKVLDAVAWFYTLGNSAPLLSAIAFKAGYTVGTGRFKNLCSTLLTRGLVSKTGDGLKLTDAGMKAAAWPAYNPTRAELHASVLEVLGSSEGKLMKLLLERGEGGSMALAELASMTQYTLGTGRFKNLVSRLKSLGLAVRDGDNIGPAACMFP